MKLVKMSLAAAMLMGASAFAIENTKISGDAKLFYATTDADDAKGNSVSLFDKTNAAGQAALGLGLTTDLLEGVSAGAHMTALTTLGLQGQLVDNVWEATNGVDDYYWFDEAWFATTVGKTTAKVGRMALDTPLVFTETWSIASNTFEAAVLLNQDLPDTTLVGAYVGGSNGGGAGGYANVVAPVNANGTTNFSQFYNGAYTIGLVNNSFEPVTAQAWYYDATHAVTAYWLQADLSMDGIVAGLQFTANDWANAGKSAAWAGKLGYETDAFTVSAAYSNSMNKSSGGSNFAGVQSKLYTEAWWNYGYIGRGKTSAFNLTGTYDAGVAALSAFYTSSSQDTYSTSTLPSTGGVDMSELTLEADKSFGPLDASLLYIYTKADDQNNGDAYNTIQAYLTLNF